MVVKGELTEEDGHMTTCAVKKLKRMSSLLLYKWGKLMLALIGWETRWPSG